MERQKRSVIGWSSAILLILAMFFYVHYCFYLKTNIYALQATIYGYFTAEFASVIFHNRNMKKEWHYLVLATASAICFIITFALYFLRF